MPSAFCPGHVTCFFQPSDGTGHEMSARGSRGVGIRISSGAAAEVSERADGEVHVSLDGIPSQAPVSRFVISSMMGGRGADIAIENAVPCGNGFGMSAAGAIALALCISDITGADISEVYKTAHAADIVGGGGLGDVCALRCLAHVPVRIEPGLPPFGNTIGLDVRFERLTLAVLGPKMNTGAVLADENRRDTISNAGKMAMEEFFKDESRDAIFSLSNSFSAASGVESREVSEALAHLHDASIKAGMCMLGNSIFADAGEDEVLSVIGECQWSGEVSSTAGPAKIIRKA